MPLMVGRQVLLGRAALRCACLLRTSMPRLAVVRCPVTCIGLNDVAMASDATYFTVTLDGRLKDSCSSLAPSRYKLLQALSPRVHIDARVRFVVSIIVLLWLSLLDHKQVVDIVSIAVLSSVAGTLSSHALGDILTATLQLSVRVLPRWNRATARVE